MSMADAKLKSDAMALKTHYVYIFQCEGGKRYCGMTGHVINRFVAHATKKGSRVTRAFPPISLLHLERVDTFYDAIKREIKIKQLMRKRCDIGYRIVPEYQGIFCIIQEMLKKYKGSYVKRKLNETEREVINDREYKTGTGDDTHQTCSRSETRKEGIQREPK